MSDNVTLPVTGTGTADVVQATDDVSGVHYPIVKLADGTLNSAALIGGDATNGLDVDVTRVGGDVTVIGKAADGAAVDGNPVLVAGQDGTNVQSLKTDSTGRLEISDNTVLYEASNTSDNTAFTQGASGVLPSGFIYDEVAGSALTENNAAAARIDAKRAQVAVIEDATTRGRRATVTAGGALSVDASGAAVPVTDNGGSVTVDNAGTFAVQADTELPTAGALGDAAAANPTTPTVGAVPLLMNATTVDRQRAVLAGLDAAGTGIAAAGLVAQLDDVATTSVTENQFAPVRLSSRRALLVEGVASGTAQPISGSVTIASGSVTADTELNSAAALADTAAANVTTATVGAVPLLMNASSLDRQRAVLAGLDSTGIGIAAAGLVGQLDDASTTTVTENQFAPVRISSRRAVLVEGVTSGTAVTVTQTTATNLKTAIFGNAGATLDGTVAAGTAPTDGLAVLGLYNNTAVAPTAGQSVALQLDQAGNVRAAPSMAMATGTGWTNATALNATQTIFSNHGCEAVLLHLVQGSTISAGAITFEVSYDNSNWVTIPADAVLDPASTTLTQISVPYTLQQSTNKPFLLNSKGWQGLRIKLSTQITGTGTVTPNYALLPHSPADTVIALSPTAANFNATVSGTVTASSTTGSVAHDGVDSGNPVKVGGRASNALATATMVASADRTDLITDLDGVLIARPHCPIANIIHVHSSMTGTTSTALTAFSNVASTRNMVTSIAVHNSGATDTYVALQDGNAGTTFFIVPAPSKGGATMSFQVPLPQPTTNTALYWVAGNASTTVYASVTGFQTKAG